MTEQEINRKLKLTLTEGHPRPSVKTITMKQLIIICLLGLAGCENSNTITWKSFYTYDDMRLPDSICRFGYNSGNEFQDSCKLYLVGDTIKSK